MAEPRIFISHSTADADFANRFSDDLRRLGADVWLDSSHMGAGDFVARINTALAGREFVLLVLSPNAIQSPWVNQEVNAGIAREKQGVMRPMIVVMAQHCTPSTIPPLWTVYHRYDATQNYTAALHGVARQLGIDIPQQRQPENLPPNAPDGHQQQDTRARVVQLTLPPARVVIASIALPLATIGAYIAQFLLYKVPGLNNVAYQLARTHQLFQIPNDAVNQLLWFGIMDMAVFILFMSFSIREAWRTRNRRPNHPLILGTALAAIVLYLIALWSLGPGSDFYSSLPVQLSAIGMVAALALTLGSIVRTRNGIWLLNALITAALVGMAYLWWGNPLWSYPILNATPFVVLTYCGIFGLIGATTYTKK